MRSSAESAVVIAEATNIDNVEEYIQLLSDFLLDGGIKSQLEAFGQGFQEVFPIEKLALFTPAELRWAVVG